MDSVSKLANFRPQPYPLPLLYIHRFWLLNLVISFLAVVSASSRTLILSQFSHRRFFWYWVTVILAGQGRPRFLRRQSLIGYLSVHPQEYLSSFRRHIVGLAGYYFIYLWVKCFGWGGLGWILSTLSVVVGEVTTTRGSSDIYTFVAWTDAKSQSSLNVCE
jgi:hypothetical protein